MQTKFSFDKESLKKIGKGLLIAMSGPALLGGLQFLSMIEISDPNLAVIYAAVLSALVNLVKEYVKGE